MKTTEVFRRRGRWWTVTVVLAFLSGAARAELPIDGKVYGFLNGQVEAAWAYGGATPYGVRGRVSDGNSRVGFIGTLALGPATKVLVQIEGGLNNFEQGGVSDQGLFGTIVSRNTFIGVEDERFGRLVLGNNESAYRNLGGSADGIGGNLGMTTLGLDLWNNSSAQMSGNAWSIYGRGEARYKNSVHYLSPDWKGFKAAASYSFDELVPQGAVRDRFSVALAYRWGELKLGLAVDYQRNTGVDMDKLIQGFGLCTTLEAGVATYYYRALATYKLPTRTFLGAAVERSNYGYSQMVLPTSTNPYTALQSGVMSQFGAMFSAAQEFGDHFVLMASFGRLGNLAGAVVGSASDFAALQVSAGARYTFNDNFAMYVFYTMIQNGPQQTVNYGQSPLYTNNLGTTSAYLAPGNGPSAAGLGLIARF